MDLLGWCIVGAVVVTAVFTVLYLRLIRPDSRAKTDTNEDETTEATSESARSSDIASAASFPYPPPSLRLAGLIQARQNRKPRT